MADAVGQAEVGKEGEGPAGMTCLVYTVLPQLQSSFRSFAYSLMGV